jgi:hypothetical protein
MWGLDNIAAALEHNARICRIDLWRIPRSQVGKLLTAIRQPFPALTRLQLELQDETAPVDPSSFLGGSAQGLHSLTLVSVPFPGLPKLLLSAAHLVHLQLWRIPHSGYISPEAMVAGLSVLTRLESLFIGFESPRCRPDRRTRRPPTPTRTVLPVLTELWFKGASEYLEDLMARIDVPPLEKLGITFFHQLIFDTSQVAQFISRTPKFKTSEEARVVFSDRDVSFTLPQQSDRALAEFGISCRQPDWQLSSVAQVFSSFFRQSLIPAVEHLHILENGFSRLDWQDDIENNQWLELFHSFPAVKSLYISSEFMPRIALALQELAAVRVTEVLPALQTLFLEPLPSGPVQEIIGQFVAARRLAGHPITVTRWERGERD